MSDRGDRRTDQSRWWGRDHGVWPTADPNGGCAVAWRRQTRCPLGQAVNKNVSIRMGRNDDKRWNSELRDMIINGAGKPSQVVSHRLRLDQAPDAFAKFDAGEQGYVKVILKPS